ncbi:uncharacterized protein LOC116359750 isoform X1 [Oncorhynchus kisutch]|uniref:uncharacterized protein LOC116359750 isoform X1 n=1 Tax=Oncorhynchus kisutch TaxID=8019 RepID=UPI0012DC0C60|nr:uncharacterized protein LOC116359750 isoform X1 [Oncorhynchus kisutch]
MQLVSMCGNIFRLSLLLLLLGQCSAVEVTQNKILETRGADATLFCPKQTLTDISTVVCHKNRVISGGHECRVSHDVETNHTNSSCDPRVTLQIENDRVCLHITNIQPSDEGNYTCQCGYNGGRDYIDIHISVNGAQVQQATDNSLFYLGMITGVAACVAVLVFGGVIMRKIHLRTQLQVSGNVKEEEQRDIEPYSTFTRKTNGLYSTLQLLNP